MTVRILISFLILNIFTVFSGQAQVIRDFEDRASFDVNGNITMAGNTLLTCKYNWFTDRSCNDVKNGTSSGSNGRGMYFINIDSAAGYNNSSSAGLTIPNGATVLHAELYWAGRHNSTEANRDKIRIKAPGSSSYQQVIAHSLDTIDSSGSTAQDRPYQASADVTQIVQTAGSGNYTVANLTAKEGNDGLGFYGGWAIAVIYQDNTQPFRRLMLLDGAAEIEGNNTVSITIDNLITPYSGQFDTYLGALVWEGDESIDGDAFIFENNILSDPLNPADNYWNSSITAFNSRVSNKNPDYVNQLGMDLVMIDVSGILANGKTQASIDFVTDGDTYFPQAMVFVTELFLPDFSSSIEKTAIDLNGGQVEPGDVIEYRIAFENTGQDIAINTVVKDALPTGLTFLPGSLEIVTATSGPSGAMSDSASDDAAEYDANSRTISFWVGNNAGPNQGGDFLPGESAMVKFFATVDSQNSGPVSNTAHINFNSSSNPNDPLTAGDDVVIDVVASASISVTKNAQLTIDNGNPGTADAGDEITFGISVENTGNLAMSNIILIDPMASNGVTCPSSTLAPFSSMSCDSYTYTVTQEDMNIGGSIDNTVELSAIDGANNIHEKSDSTQTFITLLSPVITTPTDGDLVNDNPLTVSGTGQVGAVIDVLTDQGGSCQTIVDSQGNWSCDISPTPNDGTVIISAFASDGGTNQSATTSLTINLDTQAPDAPGVDAPTNGQPITGTGEPGATVTVTTDNGDTCTTTVQADGSWSCDLGPDVVHGDTITVTQEDEAGNVSPETIIPNGIDILAPAVTITSPTDGDLTNDNTPTVSGVSEADAIIVVTIGGVEVCSTVADSNGDWACDVSPAIADGTVQIDVTATDAAGNTSDPESVTITIDATAPSAPGINAPTNGQPVTGTGEPGSVVDVVTESGASCTAIVQADGTWSCSLTGNLVDGDDIIATQTDEAGNTSDETVVPGGLDTLAPNVIITSPTDGDLTNENTPTVSGVSEADAIIVVTIGGVEVCSTVADSNGDWACDVSPAIADGTVQIDVTATDAAGNTSDPESVTITIDATAPSAPGINAPTNGQPVSGTGEPGAIVDVTTPSGATCSATVLADGSWSCDLGPNVEHGEDITADQTDPAGNTSEPTTVTGGIDTEAPDAPIIVAPADGDLSNNNTPTVSGTSEADAIIVVTIGGVEVCSTVADSNGDWACDVSPAITDGTIQIDVTATDPAGNTSDPESVTITIDTLAPDAPVITTPTNGQPVSGTDGEPGATVNVTTPSGATCSAIVQADGTWSCELIGNLVDGDDIIATQTDEAGNTSDETVVPGGLDTKAPDVPTIVTPQAGSTINNPSPIISGTAEAGSTVTVTNQFGPVCVTEADSSGQWSCTPASPLSDGEQQLVAVATDVAGNESQPATVSFTVNSGATYALVVDAPTELRTTEAGGTDTFTIVLPLSPSADVTVNISSSDTTEGTVLPETVTFTAANWDQAVTITVTGVDDNEVDFDQLYTIDFSPLSSQDSNYNGIGTDSINAVNEDDDGHPDLSVFITNCIDGSLPQQPVKYTLTVSNEGNTAVQGARLTTLFSSKMSAPSWICLTQDGQACSQATGQGDLDKIIDLNVNETMVFTMNADVNGQLNDYIDVRAAIEMPNGEIDVNPANNQAEDSDLLYYFLFKDGFECAAPGTIGTDPTNPNPVALTLLTPNNGDFTNNSTPTVSGTSDAGATISVTINNVEVCSAIADVNGDWACAVSPAINDGTVQINVTASDIDGNTSEPQSVTITVDTVAPDAPGIGTPTNGQPITGTGEPGATVNVTTPSGASCSATVQADGSWSCDLGPDVEHGEDITATQTDQAGNTSEPTTVTGGIDTQAPDAPIIVTPEAGSTLTTASPLISGTAEVGSTVTVSNQSGVICEAQTNSSGLWSCTPDSPLAEGAQQLQAVATNVAGNDSLPSTVSFTVNSGAIIEQPDLSVFITNCIDGSLPEQPITYYLTVSNEGDKDIQGARLTTLFPQNIVNLSWDCETLDGQACSQATGLDNLDEIIDLNVDEAMLFTMTADVYGNLHDFIDVTATITMPNGETDVNPANNHAEDSDLLYQFLFKDGFECAAPGTIGSTTSQLEQLLNLQ